MKEYTITYVKNNADWANIPEIEINEVFGKKYDDISAKAQVAYTSDCLLLHLSTVESNYRKVEKDALGSPCEDSCLEFFFSPINGDKRYFNVEFNANGCMFLGMGSSVYDLTRLIFVGDELFKPEIIENDKMKFNIGSQVVVSGIITKMRNQLTKKGEMMRYIELEDLSGSIEVLIFPGQLRRFDTLAQIDKIVTLSGNLDIAEDAPPKIRLEDLKLLDLSLKKAGKLYIRTDSRNADEMDKIKEILGGAMGDIEVIIKYSDTGQVLKAPKSMQINRNDGRVEKLEALLGNENVRLVE